MECLKKKKLQKNEDIINDDDIDVKQMKTRTRKRKHKKQCCSKHKRKVEVAQYGNTENLVITQRVKVKKQKIQCTINVSELKCKGKSAGRKKHSKRSRKDDRIVPHCLRDRCKAFVSGKSCKNRHTQKGNHIQNDISKRNFPKIETVKPSSPAYDLSPISLSSISKCTEILYEDISSDSLSNYSEDYMDSLIKRTKDRDTKQCTFKRQQPACTDVPINVENNNISDAETVTLRSCDDSLYSGATLVLEPRSEIYSPTDQIWNPEHDNHIEPNTDLNYTPLKSHEMYETFINHNIINQCPYEFEYINIKVENTEPGTFVQDNFESSQIVLTSPIEVKQELDSTYSSETDNKIPDKKKRIKTEDQYPGVEYVFNNIKVEKELNNNNMESESSEVFQGNHIVKVEKEI